MEIYGISGIEDKDLNFDYDKYYKELASLFVAFTVPTIHGTSNSLDIIAAWQVIPPSSVIKPAAFSIAEI